MYNKYIVIAGGGGSIFCDLVFQNASQESRILSISAHEFLEPILDLYINTNAKMDHSQVLRLPSHTSYLEICRSQVYQLIS